MTRNLSSRDESDIDGCGVGDDDVVEPRTEEEDDAESSDLVKLLRFSNFQIVVEISYFDNQRDSRSRSYIKI